MRERDEALAEQLLDLHLHLRALDGAEAVEALERRFGVGLELDDVEFAAVGGNAVWQLLEDAGKPAFEGGDARVLGRGVGGGVGGRRLRCWRGRFDLHEAAAQSLAEGAV